MKVIELPTSTIWEKISTDGMPSLSEEELEFFVDNPEEFIEKSLFEISTEIERLQENKENLDPTCFYWSLRIVSFFREPSSFELIEKLCLVSSEKINKALGAKYFASLGLRFLIALTARGHLEAIYEKIANNSLEKTIRRACAESLLIMYLNGNIGRSELVEHLKNTFNKIIKGDIDDGFLASTYIKLCSDIWPGECIEEIKEIFGLNLLDEELSIHTILKKFNYGKKKCLDIIRDDIWSSPFLTISEELFFPSKDEFFKIRVQKNEILDQAFKYADSKVVEPGRNDPCHCLSGLKYKKCCKSKLDYKNETVESFAISYAPLNNAEYLDFERAALTEMYYSLGESPEKAYDLVTQLLKKYPDYPDLHNHLYNVYLVLGLNREAMAYLMETIRKFPDYLFAKLEYCIYFLRRGEPEKVKEIFPNANTLKQVFPDRDTFHISEFCLFNCVMGWYFADIGEINAAKIYLSLIKEVTDEDDDKFYNSVDVLRDRIVDQILAKKGIANL